MSQEIVIKVWEVVLYLIGFMVLGGLFNTILFMSPAIRDKRELRIGILIVLFVLLVLWVLFAFWSYSITGTHMPFFGG